MDYKVKELLEKVRSAAELAGDAAGKGIDAASKKTNELAAVAKLNKQIFDLNTEIHSLMREVGRMVYATHRGEEVDPEELEQKLAAADEKFERLDECRKNLAELRPARSCPNCGESCGKHDRYCKHCGTVL